MMVGLRALWITLLAMLLLSPVAGSAGALTDSDRDAYRAAFVAVHAADWSAAYRNAALANDPVLQKAVRYFALTRGDPSARFGEIVQFLTQNPNWPGETQLRQRADDVAASASDAEVQAWYDRFPPITPFGKLRQAELWLGRGDTARATEQIRQIWINSDLNAFDEKSMLQKYGIYLRPADHVARLDRLLWDGREEQARRMLPMVDAGHRLEAEARMALAAHAPKAEKLLHDVPSELQNDPGLLFERMQWRRHQDDYDGAIAILDHAPTDLRPDAWYHERELLARRALQTGSIALAYRLASHNGLTTGPNFADGEFLAGWIALRFLHDPQTAYTHFVHIYGDATRPITLTRAAYWAGRAAEELKYRELSTTWYTTAAQYLTTYYGQLAASQIGADGKAAVVEDPHPTPAQTAAFDQNELVRVIRAMGEASAADLTKPFMLRLAELAKTPPEYTLIAHLAQDIGRTDVAVTVARRASFVGVTLLDVGYPLADMPAGNNLEAPLVLAVTRQESGFDPTALSPAGARGMMQLMPGTAKTVAKNLQIAYSQQRLLEDASYNMTLGCAYLSDMLDRFGGSYVLAVAAYNAGPARVNQWLQALGDPRAPDVDAVDWVESISIGETRNYVQRVLENLQIYRLRLGDRSLAFSLPTDLKR